MSLSHSSNIVTNGLTFYVDAANNKSYPGTGTTWNDLVGSNNRSLVGGPVYNTANKGYFSFDGIDDYTSFPMPSNPGSICFWYYFNQGTIQSLIVGNETSMLYVGGTPGIITAYRFGTEDYSFSHLVSNTSQWIYICLTYVSNTSNKMYVNGILRTSSTTFNFPKGSVYNVAGGGTYTAQNCRFSMIKTYNRELTDAEVLQNYNATKSRYGL